MAATSDWEAHKDRFPMLNEPDPSYHGAVWTEAVKPMGPIAYIIKARVTLLRDLGSAMSPFNGFQFIQGLETLPLRIRAHSENAATVAEYLSGHDKVGKVIHPSVMDGEARRRADAVLRRIRWSVRIRICVGWERSRPKVHRQPEHVLSCRQYWRFRSLAIHPATTTHSQLSPEEQEQQASPIHMYGYRSESNISTISSAISIRRWQRYRVRAMAGSQYNWGDFRLRGCGATAATTGIAASLPKTP